MRAVRSAHLLSLELIILIKCGGEYDLQVFEECKFIESNVTYSLLPLI